MQKALDFIRSQINDFTPEIAIILGSGLGCFCDNLEGISLKYSDIPDFGVSNIEGHKGELLFSKVENKNCAIMQGRFHFYEGYSMQECTKPVKILKLLGVKTLIITNAAGAAHKGLNAGDIMMINDHINFMGTNPLIGKNDNTLGVRFPDMSDCYTNELQIKAREAADELGLDLKEGIYLATTGPSYETSAEVRAYRILGADVIGMSSVPEAIVANYLNMDVLGFSLVTNYATGVSNAKLTHQEVLETGKKSSEKLSGLIKKVISKLD
ncbi:purine-nucleoside phosphorylase [bacterium]|nr:purine-nucleoside phosphorylase [bacterium]